MLMLFSKWFFWGLIQSVSYWGQKILSTKCPPVHGAALVSHAFMPVSGRTKLIYFAIGNVVERNKN